MELHGLTHEDVDDRMKALEDALRRSVTETARRVPGRNLWVAAAPVGMPPMRVYLRPRPDVPDQAEWMWIEEQL